MSRARWLITSRSLHKMNSFSLPPTSSYINRNGYISKLQAIILSHAIVHWMLLPWLKMTLPCNQTGSHVHDSLYGHFKKWSKSATTKGDMKRKYFIFSSQLQVWATRAHPNLDTEVFLIKVLFISYLVLWCTWMMTRWPSRQTKCPGGRQLDIFRK